MILTIPDVLNADEVRLLRQKLDDVPFVDGAATAGKAAKLVKDNLQADMTTPQYSELNKAMLPVIAHNELFRLACLPQKIAKLKFSRYRESMAYGFHVNSPLLEDVRADVAFTLFLARPDEYVGGELVIADGGGERMFKLASGHMIAYPATTLHRVAAVTGGERIVVFGWAQSAVRSASCREILYDLEVARRNLLERHGAGLEIDLLGRARGNLVRMWAEL